MPFPAARGFVVHRAAPSPADIMTARGNGRDFFAPSAAAFRASCRTKRGRTCPPVSVVQVGTCLPMHIPGPLTRGKRARETGAESTCPKRASAVCGRPLLRFGLMAFCFSFSRLGRCASGPLPHADWFPAESRPRGGDRPAAESDIPFRSRSNPRGPPARELP